MATDLYTSGINIMFPDLLDTEKIKFRLNYEALFTEFTMASIWTTT